MSSAFGTLRIRLIVNGRDEGHLVRFPVYAANRLITYYGGREYPVLGGITGPLFIEVKN